MTFQVAIMPSSKGQFIDISYSANQVNDICNRHLLAAGRSNIFFFLFSRCVSSFKGKGFILLGDRLHYSLFKHLRLRIWVAGFSWSKSSANRLTIKVLNTVFEPLINAMYIIVNTFGKEMSIRILLLASNFTNSHR